jgi:hypothetical protein
MAIENKYMLRFGARSHGVDPESETIYIGNTANCGLYCHIGHGLYGSFVQIMNSDIGRRKWKVVFSDLSAWINHAEDGRVLEHLFLPYNNLSVDIPEDPKVIIPGWGTNDIQTTKVLQNVSKYFSKCFKTNSAIDADREVFEQKYNINYAEVLAVCYRGTNKYTECKLASTEAWIQKTKDVLSSNKQLNRVLIQTDQEQLRDAFMAEFGSSCFFFEEIAVTADKNVMHHVIKKEDKLRHTKNIHTAVSILAKHEYLINHAGNTGYAIATYRGTARNMWLFDNTGTCIPPNILHNVTDNV